MIDTPPDREPFFARSRLDPLGGVRGEPMAGMFSSRVMWPRAVGVQASACPQQPEGCGTARNSESRPLACPQQPEGCAPAPIPNRPRHCKHPVGSCCMCRMDTPVRQCLFDGQECPSYVATFCIRIRDRVLGRRVGATRNSHLGWAVHSPSSAGHRTVSVCLLLPRIRVARFGSDDGLMQGDGQMVAEEFLVRETGSVNRLSYDEF